MRSFITSLRVVTLFTIAMYAIRTRLVRVVTGSGKHTLTFRTLLVCIGVLGHFMMMPMLCWANQQEILNPVIRLDAIQVMDVFPFAKRSAEMLFHYDTMLMCPCPIFGSDANVPEIGETALSTSVSTWSRQRVSAHPPAHIMFSAPTPSKTTIGASCNRTEFIHCVSHVPIVKHKQEIVNIGS